MKTRSCGTLLKGEEIIYKGAPVKLCGCIMPIKAHLKASSCPINTWTSLISQKDLKQLKTTLGEMSGNRITKEQNIILTELHNKIAGRNNRVSSCGPCVKEMVKELKTILEQ